MGGQSEIYFIGIGGIGMSALARYFHTRGKKVSGYDRTETSLTRQLVAEGIAVHYDDDPGAVPEHPEFVVYTPAIPASHRGLMHCREKGFTLMKRSEVLGWITRSSFNICVAGTHGKTTTSTLIAHILRHSGYGCNAFLGGIAVNYGSNYWNDANEVCVMEADEYDRSFLKLFPDIAVISSMDADHLDIYGTVEAMEQAFLDFARQIKKGGCLILKEGLKRQTEFRADHLTTYSLDDPGAVNHASSIRPNGGGYRFDAVLGGTKLEDVHLPIGGLHNIENAVAAITVAWRLNIAAEKIRAAVADFKGVKRRFEYVIAPGADARGLVMIDDYAHHPEELSSLIRSGKDQFTGKACTVVFQPHLFSRTRDLAKEFGAALDLADEVVLLPIYPARELPLEGVSSEMLIDKMKLPKKRLLDKKQLLEWAAGLDPVNRLLIFAGAGDIDTLVEPVRDLLTKKQNADRVRT